MLNAYSPVHYKAFAFILSPTLVEYDKLKDRIDDQRGGSEWEPIKILLEGD
jgi:hypothetical protein